MGVSPFRQAIADEHVGAGFDEAIEELLRIRGCRRYADYTAMCEEIESYFRVVGGAELSRVDVGDGTLSVGMPRLLVGTPDQPDADLDAMRAALEGVLDRPDVECVDGRVNVCLPLPDGVELLLSDGRIVRARKVILAAGVVGSMGILLRSIPGIESAEFADHAPYMLYTFGSFGWLGKAPADFRPFQRPDGGFGRFLRKAGVRIGLPNVASTY